MRLPHRDPIRLGPTAYELFQEKEGIPSVTGFFIEEILPWEFPSSPPPGSYRALACAALT